MQEPIQRSASHHGIAVEDVGPLAEGFIGGQDYGAAGVVALASRAVIVFMMRRRGWADMKTQRVRRERGFLAQPIFDRTHSDRNGRTILHQTVVVRAFSDPALR